MRSTDFLKRLMGIAAIGLFSTAIGHAGTLEGSAVIPRADLDSAFGQVFIYDGGTFDTNEKVTTFTFLGIPGYPRFNFSDARFITPVLFEQTAPGVFVVRGVGAGQTVTSSGLAQSFTFNLQEGIDTTTAGDFTFGFINALVDTNGNQTSSSAGAVSFIDVTTPGQGVGGAGTTNRWVFTMTLSGLNVALGTTFGIPGTSATFGLNDPGRGSFDTDRTYSATLNGVDLGGAVPEPATVGTIGAGLVALWAARRRIRGL